MAQELVLIPKTKYDYLLKSKRDSVEEMNQSRGQLHHNEENSLTSSQQKKEEMPKTSTKPKCDKKVEKKTQH